MEVYKADASKPRTEYQRKLPQADPDCIDVHDPLTYLFPEGVHATTMIQLQRLIVGFYRDCLNYERRSRGDGSNDALPPD